MRNRAHLPEEERSRLSRLKQLLDSGDGLLRASLYYMKRRCGKPYCHCTRGELHVSLYLCHSQRGKSRLKYVSAEEEAQVRAWVERYKEARRLLDEVAQMHWERLHGAKG